MAYTPTNTFAVATTMVGADVQENLDGLKTYVCGTLRASDFATNSWAKPRHIVRGKYDTIVNNHSFASGLDAGRNSEANETSWVTRATTGAVSGSAATFSYYPNAAITFYLEQDAHVILQFYASPVNSFRNVSSQKDTYLYIYVDETDQITMSRNTIRSEADGALGGLGPPGVHDARNNFAGYHMTTMTKGYHSLSLKAYSTSLFTFLCNWGVSVEAYYK